MVFTLGMQRAGWVGGLLASLCFTLPSAVLMIGFAYHPVWIEGVKSPRDAAAAVLAFGLLQWWKAPPWLVVILAAAAGHWLLP